MTDKTITSYDDLPFAPLAEGSPIEIAHLWGNMETGPCALMIRVPEGVRDPWHSHSATYRAVLIKGQFQSHEPDSEAKDTFGPGSYIVQPGGAVHAEDSRGPGELVAMLFFDGPPDYVLDE